MQNDFFNKIKAVFESGVETEQEDSLSMTHYCSFETGMNILKGNSLWSTDHRYLNDPLEVSYGVDKIIESLKNYHTSSNGLIKASQMIEEKTRKDQYHMLISSFVKHDDYLPSWRYYGDNGHGLAITFNREQLINGFEARGIKSHFADVIYINDKQDEFLQKLIKCYLNSEDRDDSLLIIYLFLCAPIFKHNDWHDEREVRIISPHVYMENGKTYIPTELPRSSLIEASDRLQYDLFKFEYHEIEKVTFGPCLDFDKTKLRLLAEFVKLGHDRIPFKIEKSKKSYRS